MGNKFFATILFLLLINLKGQAQFLKKTQVGLGGFYEICNESDQFSTYRSSDAHYGYQLKMRTKLNKSFDLGVSMLNTTRITLNKNGGGLIQRDYYSDYSIMPELFYVFKIENINFELKAASQFMFFTFDTPVYYEWWNWTQSGGFKRPNKFILGAALSLPNKSDNRTFKITAQKGLAYDAHIDRGGYQPQYRAYSSWNFGVEVFFRLKDK